jgi:phospholipid N-methyltransferase
MARSLYNYLHFLWAGLLAHQQTGAIVPSQRFLIEKMIAPIPDNYSGEIFELGAGNGALTVRLARKCRQARILACEINPTLARDLRENLDHAGINGQVRVFSQPAEQILSSVRAGKSVDYIISGIPIGNVSKDRTLALIRQIRSVLSRKGMYIQFQHSLLDRGKIQANFSALKTVPVLLNFPPAFIYYASKAGRG